MTVSRRSVLLQGCVIGAGVIAAHVPGIVALAQGTPKLRRSLLGMPLNDPIISAWRDAVGQLKAPSKPPPINWTNFATIHGTTAGFNLCPHQNWYFLPWHRAYLLMYERVVRELTSFPDFALPYWDWTAQPQLPQAFTDATFNGKPNPLFESSRTMGPGDSLAPENVGQAVIDGILHESPFETFGTTRPNGQNSLDPSWIKNRSGIQGTLENNPHNSVHRDVGGIMRTARSSNDPIFMMHHCNIDRIWWMWNSGGNQNSDESFWRDMPFKDNFLNPDGTFSSPKVSDLFTPETLGYTYDLGFVPGPVVSAAPLVTPLSAKFTTLFAAPRVADVKAPGLATFVAEVTAPAAAGKVLEIPIKVDPEQIAAVARSQRPASGATFLNARAVQLQLAAAPRALCFIRDITVANDQDTQFRVFVNADDLSADVPITNRHYAGTFAFFGAEHGHGEGLPSVSVDLTRTLQNLYGTLPAPDTIRIQILPVARNATVKEVGTVRPSRVEVAFVTA
jgi:tyrosinase